MRWRAVALVVGAMVGSGCYAPKIPHPLRCSDAGLCPGGEVCIAGYCNGSPGGADAGAPLCNGESRGTGGADAPCTATGDCRRGFECELMRCAQCCDGTGTGPHHDCELPRACVEAGAPTLSGADKALADHCDSSTCNTGTLFAPCSVGQNAWSVGAVGFDHGMCIPQIDNFGGGGFCVPVGSLAEGAPCTPFGVAEPSAALKTLPAGTPLCGAGLACLPPAPGAAPACLRVCDPRATPDPCPAGAACRDGSYLYSETMLFTGSFGVCAPGARCSLFDDGCTNLVTYQGAGVRAACESTTPARSSGFCLAPRGSLGEHSPCDPEANAPVNARCLGGLACMNLGEAQPTCHRWCDTTAAAGAPHGCAAGQMCTPITWGAWNDVSLLNNGAPGTVANGFGLCK